MKLKHLITEANQSLYEKVSERFPVQLKKAKEEVWSSVLETDKIIISYTDSNAFAAFTHELLHIDTQLNGYKRLRSGMSLNPAVHRQLPFLCEAIDREFQHHKMYGRFLEMGFSPSEFYTNQDAITTSYIERGLLSKGQSLLSIAMVYFTMMAPGNTITGDRLTALKEDFRNYDEGSFRKNFDVMDDSISKWIATPTYDAEPHLQKLLTAMGATDTWISYVPVPEGPSFPADGFFVDRPFTEEEAQEVFARTGLGG